MKKFIMYIIAFAAVMLTSCSNEDVPVSKNVTFKINPSTVISSFIEFNAGELSSIGSDQNLRVRLLIYNESGRLQCSDTQYMNDYTHMSSFGFSLPVGVYKAVAITDIVSDNRTFEFWTLTGEDNINTTTITDAGYVGGSSKILGLTVKDIEIGESSGTEYNIDVRPAGALAIVWFKNWNRYTNVDSFALYSNRSCDSMTLNSEGNPVYSVEASNDMSWRIALMGHDSSYSGGYVYVFLFPLQNASMHFGAELNNDRYTLFPGADAVVDIELGREYMFTYDVTSEECEWNVFTNVQGKPGRHEYNGNDMLFNNGFMNKQSIRVADMPSDIPAE